MKYLIAGCLLLCSVALAQHENFSSTTEDVLNCKLAIQHLDRVIEVRGVCPKNSDASYVVGYYMGTKGYPAYSVAGNSGLDKSKQNRVFEYRIFIKKPLVFQR